MSTPRTTSTVTPDPALAVTHARAFPAAAGDGYVEYPHTSELQFLVARAAISLADTDDGFGDPVDADFTQPMPVNTPVSVESHPIESAAPIECAPQPVAQVTVGTVLCSRYVLDQVLGFGGDAVVFMADDKPSGPVAIKVLRPEQRHNANAVTRLKREYRQMQRLSHPGIVRALSLECDGDVWFTTMEWVDGHVLNTRDSQFENRERAIQLITECCSALEHAHAAGVVHGDIKPANILLTHSGNIKLIDFGSIPSQRSLSGVDSTSGLAATASHASPQVLSGQMAEERDDIFSIACLAYSLLDKGRHPFGRKSALEAQLAGVVPAPLSGVPAHLAAAVMRGLAPDRESRPQNMREFLQALRSVEPIPQRNDEPQAMPIEVAAFEAAPLEAVPFEAAPSPATPAAEPPRSDVKAPVVARHRSRERRDRWLAIAALLGLLLIAAGFISNAMRKQAPDPAVPTPEDPEMVNLDPVASAGSPAAPTLLPAAPALSPVQARDPGVITFQSSTIQVHAAQTLVAIPIKRLHSTRGYGVMAWRTENGNARPNIDYEQVPHGMVRFIEGQSVRSLFIPLKDGATALASGPRTFSVELRKVAGGPEIGAISRVIVIIVPPPRATISAMNPPAQPSDRSGT